jgi:hypothetical protein
MKRLPLNVLTLYADLAQSISFSTTLPASIFKQTVRGKVYLYAVEKHGSARVKRYLGPASDPDVHKRADAIRRAAADAKIRRTTVSMIKRSKDLAQSKELIDALGISAPQSVPDAIEDARRRGAKWRMHVERSLREIGFSDLTS